MARLSLVPGIDAVAVAQGTPMMGGELGWRVVLPGEDPSTAIPSDYADVSAGYFDAVGIRLVSGRGFSVGETFRTVPEENIVISESLARRLWGTATAAGRLLTIPGTRAEPEHVVRVIGVAEDVRWESLAATPPPVVYRPMRFGSTISRTNNNRLLVRSLNPPKDVVASVREMIRRIDPALLIEPFLMEDVVSLSLVQQRTFAWVLGILAILGFLLAAIGIQGLIAQAVVERNREFGIRLAVGAERRQIIQLVLRSALVLIAVGTPLGIALAAVLARVLESRLFGVSPGDPRIYAAAIAALLAVVVGASLAPAIAASRANPADVLRS